MGLFKSDEQELKEYSDELRLSSQRLGMVLEEINKARRGLTQAKKIQDKSQAEMHLHNLKTARKNLMLLTQSLRTSIKYVADIEEKQMRAYFRTIKK
ncbi:hypothetical protein H6504_00310 [Candidatus Woesearchaeota archaeon]|nr:hypothetical protein [Candidatus Woesearchaeota archaeon]